MVFIRFPFQKNVFCHHQGIKYIHDHCNGEIHEANIRSAKQIRDLRSMLPYTSSKNKLAEQIIKAILLHTNFTVQHNISFLTAEHLSPMYLKIFPDSKLSEINIVERKQFAS